MAQRAPDWLVWGGVAVLLAISFGPVDMGRAVGLFTNSQNIREFSQGFLHPDFTDWRLYAAQMWLTVQIALWGTAIAVVVAVPFGLGCARNISPPWLQQPLRLVMNLLRSVPDLLVGLMFIVAVGLGPFSGVAALAVNTAGVLAKLFSEAVEAIEPGPVEGVRATGAGKLEEVVWGVIPQAASHWTSFALYRFESNARSATVLGLIGAGGIGQLLWENLNTFQFQKLSAIVVVIVVAVSLIDLLSQAMRSRLI
jgi:phosphonate transport system permease protein